MSDDLTPAEQAAVRAVDTWLTERGYDRGDPIPEADLPRVAVAAARPYIAAELAQAVRDMPHELGDEGWAELERMADDAGWPVEWVRKRRTRDDFTTTTIEAAYQVARERAAGVIEQTTTHTGGDET